MLELRYYLPLSLGYENRSYRMERVNVKQRRLALIIGFVFIELLGYSLFLPLLPYYAGSLGASPTLIGLLVASNAVAQFVVAPFIGRLS